MEDEKSRGLLSQLIPDELENALGMTGKEPVELNSPAATLLKAAAGQAGGNLENEVNEFFNGRGALLETTRSAVERKSGSAVKDVTDFLTNKMHVAAPLAGLIAPLIVQLFPSISQIMSGSLPEKPKPRRRRKTDSSTKPAHSSKPQKPKHQSSAKPASSGKPKKPKASSNGKPKKPKTSSSRPSGKRTAGTLEIDSTEQH